MLTTDFRKNLDYVQRPENTAVRFEATIVKIKNTNTPDLRRALAGIALAGFSLDLEQPSPERNLALTDVGGKVMKEILALGSRRQAQLPRRADRCSAERSRMTILPLLSQAASTDEPTVTKLG